MSHLRLIYQLLREEYAASRHLVWQAETLGKVVNDVTYCLHLVVKAAQGLRGQDEHAWQVLVEYCLDRSMSYLLVHAIGEYLAECGELAPLPRLDLTEKPSRHWRGTEVPLLDETERAYLHASCDKPESERELNLKGVGGWSHSPPRLRDEHPLPLTQTVNKSQHWLFA